MLQLGAGAGVRWVRALSQLLEDKVLLEFIGIRNPHTYDECDSRKNERGFLRAKAHYGDTTERRRCFP